VLRVMGLVPSELNTSPAPGLFLGHLQTNKIQQLGESIASVRTPFAVLPAFRSIAE